MATSREIIEANADLKRLFDEDGFELSVKGAHLFVQSVPYLDAKRQVRRGVLVFELNMKDDLLVGGPKDHTAHFVGDYPHYADNTPITGIVHSQSSFNLSGVTAQFYFSSRPSQADANHRDKVHRYAELLSTPAREVEPGVTAQTRKLVESVDDECPFVFPDTNSARAQIDGISAKLKGLTVAIVGLGGTGSYLLDAVAKTPVNEIHLFDDDEFSLHNAYRAPGAPTREILRARQSKVAYLAGIYSRMHRRIIPHEQKVSEANVDQLKKMSFVFLSMDPGPAKAHIVQVLVGAKVPFIDTGIGVEAVDSKLLGTVNSITVTPEWSDHVGKIPVHAAAADDLYASNIQIAELNMLNAVLAVIRWKKYFGFYVDERNEHGSAYTIGPNMLTNEDSHPQVR